MPELLKLPTERLEQLRKLAELRDMPMSDLLAEFIRAEYAKLKLDLDVPGIEVSKKGGKLHLVADGAPLASIPVGQALEQFLAELRKVAGGDRPSNMFDADAWLIVARRGASIKLQNPTTGTERTMARSVAIDLADVIERKVA